MNYTAIQTAGAGTKQEYRWQHNGDSSQEEHLFLKKFIDDSTRSLAIASRNGSWHFLLGGIRSSTQDYRGTVNRVTIFVSGLTQEEARRLAVQVLSDWDGSAAQFLKGVRWIANPSHPFGWEVDFSALEAAANGLIKNSELDSGAPLFSDRSEADYDDYPQNWNNLTGELKMNAFPSTEGVKLVITGSPTETAYKQILEQADRVLCSGCPSRVMPEKKSNPTTILTPSEKSTPPSESSSATQLFTKFQNWALYSNRLGQREISLIKLSVVCVAIVTAIWVATPRPKKKLTPESSPVPVQTAPAQPARDVKDNTASQQTSQDAPTQPSAGR